MDKPNQAKLGRPRGSGQLDGQRFTVRLPQELATRLMDRARGRADFQSNRRNTELTHADSQPGGQVSDIIREALEHYLDGCDRELQEQPALEKTTASKRTRKARRS